MKTEFVTVVSELITNENIYNKMANAKNPYRDENTSDESDS